MIVTEEEAKTKWCPFARDTAEGFGTWNRNAGASEHCMCLGSVCMAWAWLGKPDTGGETTPPPRRGYCGLTHSAGVP